VTNRPPYIAEQASSQGSAFAAGNTLVKLVGALNESAAPSTAALAVIRTWPVEPLDMGHPFNYSQPDDHFD
jgi:hypothetical protein